MGCVFFDSLKQGELLSHWRGVRHRTKWAAFQASYVIWIHWFSVVWFNSAAWDFRRWLEPREVDLACSRVDTHMTLFFQSSVRIGRWALLRRQDWSPSKDWEIFAEMLLGSCCILNESWRPPKISLYVWTPTHSYGVVRVLLDLVLSVWGLCCWLVICTGRHLYILLGYLLRETCTIWGKGSRCHFWHTEWYSFSLLVI